MTAGYHLDPADILGTTFPSSHDEMVILRGVAFTSLCEHHLLPFTGTAAVAYVPNGRVVGLSKLARLVHCFAARLQIQERLTDEIADALMAHTNARGAAVTIRAHHTCMGCRGVRQADSEMVTTATRGTLRGDDVVRAQLMEASHG